MIFFKSLFYFVIDIDRFKLFTGHYTKLYFKKIIISIDFI